MPRHPRVVLLLSAFVGLASVSSGTAYADSYACTAAGRTFVQQRNQAIHITSVTPVQAPYQYPGQPLAPATIFAGDTVILHGSGFGELVDNSLTSLTQIRFYSRPKNWPPTQYGQWNWTYDYTVQDDSTIEVVAPAGMVGGTGQVSLEFMDLLPRCADGSFAWPLAADFADSPLLTVDAASRPQSAPPPVSDLRPTMWTDTKIALWWTDVVGETSYLLSYRVHGQTIWTTVPLPANLSVYTVTGLSPATRYEFLLQASNSYGTSESEIVSTVTYADDKGMIAPPNPELLSLRVVDVGGASITPPPFIVGTHTVHQIFCVYDQNRDHVISGEPSDAKGVAFPLAVSTQPRGFPWSIDRGNAFLRLSDGEQANFVITFVLDPLPGEERQQKYVALHYAVTGDGSGKILKSTFLGGTAGDFDTADGNFIFVADPKTFSGTLTGFVGPLATTFVSGTADLSFGIAVPQIDASGNVTGAAAASLMFQLSWQETATLPR